MLYWECLEHFGPQIWTPNMDPDLGPQFGTPIWTPNMNPQYFGPWGPYMDPDLGPQFGTPK
jgi:hypothetical protein